MAKSSITLRYNGKADEPITWDVLLGIFDAIWGKEARSFPCFPKVIGHVSASWRDADGVMHKVVSVDELREAYQQEKTAFIFIDSHRFGPESIFKYWPARAEVEFIVTAENRAAADKYIEYIRKEFPLISKYDLFLSYASDDSELASELKTDLEANGLKCFMAELDIPVASIWHEEIRHAIHSSKRIIMLLTPKSCNKPWVMIEAGAAWALGKDVIPALVQLSPDDLIDPIRYYQARKIDTNTQRKAFIQELIPNRTTSQGQPSK